MFESLRYNLKHNRKSVVKSATAWFLFGAIIVVMAFLGMAPEQMGSGQGGAAAQVNGNVISLAQYSEAMERLRRDPRFEQFQAMGGNMGQQIMQQQALNQLVEVELITQAAQEQQLWTSDHEVRDIIVSIPEFQEDGRFKKEIYMNYLRSVRKTAGDFETDIRKQQSVQRAYRMFSASMRPIALEAERTKALADMKANAEFVSIPTETLVPPDSISNGDVTAFLADADNQAKVQTYYESRKAEFAVPEQVKARHILIRSQAGDAESEQKAKEKVQEIARRAETEDFAKLASEVSEDPGSKMEGGLLDFFARGRMVPEFEEVAFSAPVDKVSPPVKTQFGYHLIKVLDKKPASERSFDEVKNEIATGMIARDRSRVALEGLQESLKKGDEAAIRKFASDYKLKWEETGAFAVDAEAVPKIGENDEAMRMAFNLSADQPLANSLVRQGSMAYLLRHKPVPAAKKEDQADPMMAGIQEMMAGRRSEDLFRQWVQDLRKHATVTTNTQALAR